MLYNKEKILMKKYGYSIHDEVFDMNDDWRNLFDVYPGSLEHNELVEKYIATIKQQEFIKDLYNLEKQKGLIQQKVVELADAIGGGVTFDDVCNCVITNILGE